MLEILSKPKLPRYIAPLAALALALSGCSANAEKPGATAPSECASYQQYGVAMARRIIDSISSKRGFTWADDSRTRTVDDPNRDLGAFYVRPSNELTVYAGAEHGDTFSQVFIDFELGSESKNHFSDPNNTLHNKDIAEALATVGDGGGRVTKMLIGEGMTVGVDEPKGDGFKITENDNTGKMAGKFKPMYVPGLVHLDSVNPTMEPCTNTVLDEAANAARRIINDAITVSR